MRYRKWLLGLFLFFAVPALALVGDTVNISVKTARLRNAPGHLSAIIGHLSYTDEVTVLATRGDFCRVSGTGGTGWLHRSAISQEDIGLKDSGRDAEIKADDEEVALAGRGFNQQVEERYRSQRGLSFEGVDQMEIRRVDSQALRSFIENGALTMPEVAL